MNNLLSDGTGVAALHNLRTLEEGRESDVDRPCHGEFILSRLSSRVFVGLKNENDWR